MITINNQNYSGRNLTIINNRVIIDGKDVTPDAKEINISVTANIETLKVDYANRVEVNGVVNDIEAGSADIEVKGNVGGSIQTGSGNVKCGDVGTDVKTGSGNVKCGKINGSAKTGSGNITHS